MAVSVLEKRLRQSLRLDPQVWEKIDRERGRQAGGQRLSQHVDH
jgi:hypothetical protein